MCVCGVDYVDGVQGGWAGLVEMGDRAVNIVLYYLLLVDLFDRWRGLS